MHFNNASAPLRYLQLSNRGALTKLAHTQVMRAAKTDGKRDGWAFTVKTRASSADVLVAPPPSSSRATPSLILFFLVQFACCRANICGTKYSCQRCHNVVDKACMTMVGSNVQCVVCTCHTCGREMSSFDVECHKCHFRVRPGCTTDGIRTSCAERRRPSTPPPPKNGNSKQSGLLPLRPWLRYDAGKGKMWCRHCQQYPPIGHSVLFVQGTWNLMLCSLKYHQRLGTHCVSLALWQSLGRLMSLIQTLPTHVLQSILALFRTACTILQSSCPLTHPEGNAGLMPLNGGTILPSYCSLPSGTCAALLPIHYAFFSVWSSSNLLFSPSHHTCARTAHQRKESFFMFMP